MLRSRDTSSPGRRGLLLGMSSSQVLPLAVLQPTPTLPRAKGTSFGFGSWRRRRSSLLCVAGIISHPVAVLSRITSIFRQPSVTCRTEVHCLFHRSDVCSQRLWGSPAVPWSDADALITDAVAAQSLVSKFRAFFGELNTALTVGVHNCSAASATVLQTRQLPRLGMLYSFLNTVLPAL